MAKIKVPQLEGVINVGSADAKIDNIVMKLVKDLPLTAMLRAETIITNFYISGISGVSDADMRYISNLFNNEKGEVNYFEVETIEDDDKFELTFSWQLMLIMTFIENQKKAAEKK